MTLPFDHAQSWKEKVLDADNIWAQVQAILHSRQIELPKTPRRPDVRLILNNISGTSQLFRNPGDHSSKAENIPATGDKTAAMVMVKGDTLPEQQGNARKLAQRYDLGKQGLSAAFVQALQSGEALDLVAEAYGPAPFDDQAKKLVKVEWPNANGSVDTIDPVHDTACAYGARAATNETAFLAEMAFLVKGSGTTPEQIEGGMVIAVSEDWETKKISTRPIVPSVAKDFYGKHFDSMPVVNLDAEGFVRSIDLKDGQVLKLVANYELTAPAVKPA